MKLDPKIAIIGLGYVGLPLGMAFSKVFPVLGYDIDESRVFELRDGYDRTGEITKDTLLESHNNNTEGNKSIRFISDWNEMAKCNIYIITVPTPVDDKNKPDLRLFKLASETVSRVLKKGDIVIYESTVYPGCTEEIAVPILENGSGMQFNEGFYCGYSPERINPGDKTRTITDIKKITSGSTPEIANEINELYQTIITAGTYLAPSIKVAEAAKVIENSQRDINIAFVNELSKIFHLLGINTNEVLKAASTKWNFLPFHPGLVGGHCIGIDPYYLLEKATSVGYIPELIKSSRVMNDSMGGYVANRVLEIMDKKGIEKKGATVLILGITFKENFSDVRNSRVIDIIEEFRKHEVTISIHDPIASQELVEKTYGLESITVLPSDKRYDAIIIAVDHSAFHTYDYRHLLKEKSVLFDVKGNLNDDFVDGRL